MKKELSFMQDRLAISFRGQWPWFVIPLLAALGWTQTGGGTQGSAAAPPELSSPAEPASQALVQLNGALEQLAAKVSQGVVQVLVTGYGPVDEEGKGQTALIGRQQAIGSGVIVDPDGYIMTNAHVVEGARRIRVVLPLPAGSGPIIEPEGKLRILEAKLIGEHKDSDLALLKVDATGLPTLRLGGNSVVQQGEIVFALGSPGGLRNSITMGVVSSVARQADPHRAMVYIQTDAPINPGNSGGPLVDISGTVIGINTFILSEGGGSEGLGFAIPARIVEFVYRSLRKYGHVHRSEIRAGAQTITPTLAAGLGLKQSWGVVIADVLPGGPAEAAGLKIGDIVLAADGRRIESLPVFMGVLYLHPVDQVLKLEVLRGTEKKILYIPVIEDRNKVDQLGDLAVREDTLIRPLAILGVTIDDQIRSLLPDLRIPSGVVVVGRAADLFGPDIGLTTGDVIHTLNGHPITSVEELRSELRKLKSGDPVALQVERQQGLQFVGFEKD
jgi:serine protease Do